MKEVRTISDFNEYLESLPVRFESGQQQTFVAPYTCCDRIEDYRRAWGHFEKVFAEKE